jgi:hypothetical protein
VHFEQGSKMPDLFARGTPADSKFYRDKLTNAGRLVHEVLHGTKYRRAPAPKLGQTAYDAAVGGKRPNEHVILMCWSLRLKTEEAHEAYRSSQKSWKELWREGYRWGIDGEFFPITDNIQLQLKLRRYKVRYKNCVLYIARP